jgi:3-mercaptopyruvate sulfurtransferase SseA
MRRLGSLTAVSMCAALIALAACKANDGADTRSRTADAPTTSTTSAPAKSTTKPASAAASPHADEGLRITVAELRQALEKGEAVVVDVRNEQSYKAGHIKGARWIFESDVPSRAGELPRDKMIVTYCA